MRKRVSIVLAVGSAMVMSLAALPSQAASAYHMNGQGDISIDAPGLPACVPGTPSNCTNANVPFNWGELTVQGLGVLDDAQVAGQYLCSSAGTGFHSRIRGNTSNFELTFNFQCTNSAGAGPEHIDGWFSNCASSCTGQFRSVAGHPHPVPAAPGTFAFKGFFRQGASASNPHDIGGDDQPMTCGGGFAPTAFGGAGFADATILTAAFLGHCNALAG